MNLFVTGASGFIGRAVVRNAISRGHRVLALTRHRTVDLGGAQVILGSLQSPEHWYGDLVAFRPDACLHLAWQGLPDYSLANSFLNVGHSVRLGQYLIDAGCRHVIVPGSCWEYGDAQGEVSEALLPDNPRVFAACKLAVREVLQSLCRANNVAFSWPRVFFAYGPHQRQEALVPSILAGLAAGSLPHIKTPDVRNDFVHVDDVASGLLFAAERRLLGTFNVGTGEGTPVRFIVDELCRLDRLPPAYSDRTTEGGGFWADVSRLRSAGWRPQHSLESGLLATWRDVRERQTSGVD